MFNVLKYAMESVLVHVSTPVSELLTDSGINNAINNVPVISRITSGDFNYEYSLHDKKFRIKAIHTLSKRTWSVELYSLAWKTGVDLSSTQVGSIFRSESILLPDKLPQIKSNLLIQLKFVFLQEDFIVDLYLTEEDISDMQRIEMIVNDLREDVLNNKSSVNDMKSDIVNIRENIEFMRENIEMMSFSFKNEIDKLRTYIDQLTTENNEYIDNIRVNIEAKIEAKIETKIETKLETKLETKEDKYTSKRS